MVCVHWIGGTPGILIAVLSECVKRKTHTVWGVSMSGTRFTVAVAISLAGLLLPGKAAASERPSLISHVVSPAVRDMPPQARHAGPPEEIPLHRPPARRSSGDVVDPVVQTSATTPAAAQTLGQWEGLGEGYPGFTVTAVPPDPNIAVGPHNIVQWVNNAFVVFDKSGAPVIAPVDDGTFWGLLSTCNQLGGFSDPIVQYDRASDRWIVGEVAIPLFPGLIGQFAQCFAVSTTSDPAGTYNMWAYGFGTTVPDYPKIAMWPDGYYVTWNIFEGGVTFTGAETCAWDRVGMLSGVAAPAFVCFQLSNAFASLLPSDLDGAAPPAGAPNYLMNIDPASSTLNLWRFHVDFANPNNSTFAGPIAIAGVSPFVAPCLDTQDCIPQPGTTQKLDALGDRLMYRLAYRNFGDHESIVATHTVIAPTGGMTGVRWYEVRNPNGTPTIHQQGSFAPDTDNRWMASIAMDQTGNIGVGYSVSSSGTFPSVRYTGWEVGGTPGILQNETFLVSGGGSQTGFKRWGDYSAMRIDPTDGCTFWYTQEYQATTQTGNWNTRIGSFKFPSCGQSSSPAPTTTTIASSSPTSTFGQAVTFTATVSASAATGTVQFFDGAGSLGTAALSGGSASLTTSTLAVGSHFITASYGGDANFIGSTSAALTQTVVAGTVGTTTVLMSSLNPSAYGQQVTFTAAVSPSSGPTGTVTFMDGATTLGTSILNASGVASLSVSTLAVGTHSITAQYSGDSTHDGSTSAALSQTVNKAGTTTTLTSSPNPSKSGRPVTFTATVSPSTATGTVQFFDGSTSLGSVTLTSGTATLSTSALGGGKHSITATYSGDANCAGSVSAVLTQTVTGKK